MECNWFYKFILIFLLIFPIGNKQVIGQSNNLEFDRISIEQGLSQSTVYSIIQDSKGYMWFGTEDGLNRFDGYKFEVYRNSPRDKQSLSNNRIIALYEDSNQNIWIGTLGGGVNRYNYHNNTFSSFFHDQNDTLSIGSNIVMSLGEDDYGNILIGTVGGGLSIFDPVNEVSTNYTNNPASPTSIPGNLVRSLHVTSQGQILVGTDNGLALFDSNSKSFTHITSILGITNELFNTTVFSITEDNQQNIWISIEEKGVVKINIEKKSFLHITHSDKVSNTLASNSVIDIFIDDSDSIWFATYEGLQLFNPATQTFTTYKYDPNNPYTISSNLIRCIYEDSAGIMWVGTYRDGISKFRRKYPKFIPYRNLAAIPVGLPASSVRAIYELNENELLIGTYGHGLAKLCKKTGVIHKNPYTDISLLEPTTKYLTAIVGDNSKNIWLGSDGGGLVKYNPISNTINRYYFNSKNPNGLPSNRIRCLHRDKKGTLWIGTTGEGLSKLNDDQQTFTTYRPDNSKPASTLSQDRIICIFEDDADNLWVGTSSEGLNLFNPNTEKVIQFKYKPDDSLSISSNRILCVYQDSKKRLWVGTGSGLNLYDYKTRTFKSFDEHDGLPNEVIYGILEDNNDALWISSNKGLFSFEYNKTYKPTIRSFTKEDGLQSNEFTEGAFQKLSTGELAFGGIGGINVFNPSKIIDNPIPPKVHIERITQFKNERKSGRRITQTTLTYNIDELKIPYSQNNVTFQFVALHFDNPTNNKLLYRLQGFENEWAAPEQGQRFATYTNLRPGTYTFKVIAANNDETWNNEGDTLTITVIPPFWMTWWFIILLGLLLTILVFLIIRIRTASLLRLQKVLENRVAMRTKEILQQKEEIQSQRDHLSELNAELQQKHEEILTQHEELERTQKQLIQSEKMASIGVLTAGIAHEINNPVNFVFAGVNSLMRDFHDIDQVLQSIINLEKSDFEPSELCKQILEKKKEFEFDEAYKAIEQTLNDVKLGAERTAEIVEGLRNFSRTENEDWDKTNINKIIDGVLVLLKNKYKNNIRVVKDFDENLPEIDCKRGKINQVIMNIISNAIDAIDDKGKIIITTKLKNNHCIVSIKDNGSGIDEELVSKIFDPFFTTKKVGQGVGLGLSITYGIIQEHKGFIDVKSKKGEGTEFIIRLPVKQ